MGMDAKVPLLNVTMMRFAAFADKENHEAMFLAEMPLSFDSMNPEQFREQIREAQAGQKGQDANQEQIDIKESKTYEREINGEKATFEIQKGVNKQNGREVVQGFGVFKGKRGTAFLMLLFDGKKHTEEDVQAVINSIDNPAAIGNPAANNAEPKTVENPEADRPDADNPDAAADEPAENP
jgi:hypothetical protein